MHKILTILSLLCFQNIVYAQFVIFGNPMQSNISNSGFTVSFSTNSSVQTLVKYGLTPSLELGYMGNGQNTLTHSVNMTGLSPATFYYVRPAAVSGPDTVQSTKTYYYSTASNSTGVIKVFFNGSIDNSVSNGTFPHISNSPAAIQAELIKRIDSARSKIDCSVYNNNTTAIVTALNNAHNRGVRVRYIADDGTSNTALSAALFPVLYVNTLDLMHNKFMVTDPDSVNKCFVWTGSMNWTSGNINDDYNNVVLIQDQSLAKAYVVEFEEMWGSSGSSSNTVLSKNGSQKTDNTPHLFVIGGKLIESYFSPSDRVTEQIERAILSAGGDFEFALLTITKDELGAAIINRFNSGETVAGVVESTGDQGTEYNSILAAGVEILAHTQSFDIHHKYGIIDANTPSSDPMVVTGSHNWSSAAETVNDENTLIIHDAEIANWYLQEFSKRYCELKGGAGCVYNPAIATEFVEKDHFQVILYPNPASTQVNLIVKDFNSTENLNLSIFNQLGQLVKSIQLTGNTMFEFSTVDWPNGSYFVRMDSGTKSRTEKLIIMK
jgi:phosphatidylserine/phosphatidylglycerophosphate/cardiolipin synthase-like enzyme